MVPSIDDVYLPILRAKLQAIETNCIDFMLRTGLPSKECTIVRFRGKTFIQWIGAVRYLKGSQPAILPRLPA